MGRLQQEWKRELIIQEYWPLASGEDLNRVICLSCFIMLNVWVEALLTPKGTETKVAQE